MKRGVVVAMLAVSLMSSAAHADQEYVDDMGWGSLALLCNIFYMPAKLVYAVAGGITGSFAYVLTIGDVDTAEKIWHPTLGGSWVITPNMLRDDEPVEFSPLDSDDSSDDDAAPARRRTDE